jgi:tRNA A-37 threonylcarbamoyl transferase component Bud32
MVKKQSDLLLGRYRLEETMGAGGMGTVVRARDEVLGRRVAVKLMKDSVADDDHAVERFRREARIAASLSHPGIAHIFDFGQQDGRPFIVMEFLDGQDLHSLVQREGPLDSAEAAAIAANVADALEHAHKAGAIHRDIKPGNIFLTESGEVKLTDFGIARTTADATITQAGMVMGTYLYLSPEQINGEPATASSDIYSLGCVLYQMLTRKPPFEAENPAAVGIAHISKPVPRAREIDPDIPAEIDQIVAKAMAKSPADRFLSSAEMGAALREATTHAVAAPAGVPAKSAPAEEAAPAPPEPRGEATSVIGAAPATRRLTTSARARVSRPVVWERVRRPAITALAAGILLLLFLGLARLGVGTVTLPNWTGSHIDQAMEDARKFGLHPQKVDDASERPAGEVTRQEPGAGTQVRQGSTVRLFASLGFKRVPNLIDTELKKAREQLQVLGLQAEVTGEPGEGNGDALVVDQSPPADTLVEPGSKVVLTVERKRGKDDDD